VCHRDYPPTLEFFYYHGNYADRLTARCKSCILEHGKRYQKLNRRAVNARIRKWRSCRRAHCNEVQRLYRLRKKQERIKLQIALVHFFRDAVRLP
jgi:hypothetical protein